MKNILTMNMLPMILLTTLVMGLSSCKDIFEDELSGEKIVLLSPANTDTLSNTVQTFWWQELDNDIAISNYKVEMVTPSFSNVKKAKIHGVLDSNLIMKFNN